MKRPASKSKRNAPLESYPARMTVKQVACYLNCSENLVRDLVKAGTLAAVNLATPGAKQACYRITREAVVTFKQMDKE
jgi:excisionase family DNA binding protein